MMKKLLSLIGVVSLAIYGQAQTTLFSENFETAPQTSIPAGWAQSTNPVSATNGGWQFNSTYGSNMNGIPIAAPTHHGSYCAFVDDWDAPTNLADLNAHTYPPQSIDTLKTASFSTVGQSTIFLSLDYMFWNDDGAEVGSIYYSTNHCLTWTLLTSFPDNGGAWVDSALINASAFGNQASVNLAFVYDDGYANTNNLNGYVAVGMCVDNIRVFAPVAYDLSTTTQNLAPLMQAGTAYNFSGSIFNWGGTTVTSMRMNYSVNNGAPVSQTLTPAGFSPLTSTNWSMNLPASAFTPATPNMTYKVKMWADQLNVSHADQNNANDTLTTTFTAFDSIVNRQAMCEEYTGQSCVFCMIAGPNVDSVAENNSAHSNIVRYHVPIPERDFMYNVTSNAATGSTQIDTRMGYYGVNSAPQAFLDGVAINPSTYQNPPEDQIYSSITVQNDNAVGSPFTISFNSAKCIFGNPYDSFAVSFTVRAHGTFAAGVNAQCDLTIDSLGYKQDLSQDDPQMTFASPVGSGVNIGYGYPDAPDYYYPYVLNYRHVVEDILPNAGGTNLGAFTNGSTQTVTLGWKKKHAWGEFPKGGGKFNSWPFGGTNFTNLLDSTAYDSSSNAHFVVFLQSTAGIASYNIPAKYIFQSASSPTVPLGLQEISNSGVFFKMYPNPTNSTTKVDFVLDQDQTVNIEVYNLLGENVATLNEGTMTAGQHIVTINGSGFPSGIYMVRFIAGGTSSTTSKLIIQK